MNELEPILRFLSDENFDFTLNEDAILLVSDPENRYFEDGDAPLEGVYLPLLHIDELHEKGLKESIDYCDFSEKFIDDLMFYVGERDD